MKFSHATADVFVPDGVTPEKAASRTTHLCIAAHQDDIEIMAYPGISECFSRFDRWISGVVVTNGAGSPRSGPYADFSDEQMRAVRRVEQRKAAYVGDYSIQFQLDFPSVEVKRSGGDIVQDLVTILEATRPDVLYLHNPADKHETHVAVLARCLEALRRLPRESRPQRTYGCEVWRGLDWLVDEDKVVLSASDFPNVSAALVGVFDSQISGGKRYDLATAGRRLANATYFASHSTDQETALVFALDLSPLVQDDGLSLADFTVSFIDRFRQDVKNRIQKVG